MPPTAIRPMRIITAVRSRFLSFDFPDRLISIILALIQSCGADEIKARASGARNLNAFSSSIIRA